MAEQQEKKYSMQELIDLWMMWVSHPSTVFRRKMTQFEPKVAGGKPHIVAGIGEILFLEDFLQFIKNVELEKEKNKHLEKKFFPVEINQPTNDNRK